MRRSAPSTCSSTAPAGWSCRRTRCTPASGFLCTTICWPRAGPRGRCATSSKGRARWRGGGMRVPGEARLSQRPPTAGPARCARAAHLRVLGAAAVPTTRRSRTIEAPVEELWRVIRDPHHLPRWWPRVNRVEDVDEGAFTEVMTTAKGKVVRADFHIVEVRESMHSLSWEQSVQGTPFERVLKAARTEVSLTALGPGAAPVPAAGAGGPAETTGKGAATYVTMNCARRCMASSPLCGRLRRGPPARHRIDDRGRARRPGADQWLRRATCQRCAGGGGGTAPATRRCRRTS